MPIVCSVDGRVTDAPDPDPELLLTTDTDSAVELDCNAQIGSGERLRAVLAAVEASDPSKRPTPRIEYQRAYTLDDNEGRVGGNS
jgi:hypothetical protein